MYIYICMYFCPSLSKSGILANTRFWSIIYYSIILG